MESKKINNDQEPIQSDPTSGTCNLLNTSRTAYPTDLADQVENLSDIQETSCMAGFSSFCAHVNKVLFPLIKLHFYIG